MSTLLQPFIMLLFIGQTAQDLDVLRAAHRQARESIHSLTVNMEMTYQSSNPQPSFDKPITAIAWWQQGNTIRWRQTAGGQKKDMLWRDGQYRDLSTPPRGKHAFAVLDQKGDPTFTIGGPWYAAFYSMSLEKGFAPIDKILGDPAIQKSVTTVRKGRQNVYKVVLQSKNNVSYELFFDPKRNYVVTGITVIVPKSKLRLEREVMRFREFKMGIFFPEITVERVIQDGVVTNTTRTMFKDIHINEPIAPELLAMRIPEGAHVADYQNGRLYIADENGKPKGNRSYPIPPPESAHPSSSGAFLRRSLWFYGSVVGLLCMLTLFAVWFRRRIHAG